MKKGFLLLVALLPFLVLAQSNEEDKDILVLQTGEVIEANVVEFLHSGLRGVILADRQQYRLRDVRLYKGRYDNQRGVFAVTHRMGYKAPPVSGLIRSGEINLYEAIRITETRDMRYGGSTTNRKTFNFFNQGLGEVKRANYKNLKPIMLQHPESMQHLSRLRTAHIAEVSLYSVSIGLGVSAIGYFMYNISNIMDDSSSDESFNFGIFIGFPLAAIATGATAYVIGQRKPKHVRLAVDSFNADFE